jgi:hypothetical protein
VLCAQSGSVGDMLTATLLVFVSLPTLCFVLFCFVWFAIRSCLPLIEDKNSMTESSPQHSEKQEKEKIRIGSKRLLPNKNYAQQNSNQLSDLDSPNKTKSQMNIIIDEQGNLADPISQHNKVRKYAKSECLPKISKSSSITTEKETTTTQPDSASKSSEKSERSTASLRKWKSVSPQIQKTTLSVTNIPSKTVEKDKTTDTDRDTDTDTVKVVEEEDNSKHSPQKEKETSSTHSDTNQDSKEHNKKDVSDNRNGNDSKNDKPDGHRDSHSPKKYKTHQHLSETRSRESDTPPSSQKTTYIFIINNNINVN